MADAALDGRAYKDFCQAWEVVKNYRDWKAGDELHYIDHTLLSQVTSKNGKEHTKGAEFGIGDYFSAGGKQYDQEGDVSIVPAVAYDDVYYSITEPVIKRGCAGGRPSKKHKRNLTALSPLSTVEFVLQTSKGLVIQEAAPTK